MLKQRPLILLAEDDALIRESLTYALENAAYTVRPAESLRKVIALLREADEKAETLDLALLDMNLGDGSGFVARQRLRESASGRDAAIIYLTVIDEEATVVRALEGGADDYITKPFRLPVLLARIKSVLRRRAPHECGTQNTDTGGQTKEQAQRRGSLLQLGDCLIDEAAARVRAREDGTEKSINLSALEFRLALLFARNPGQVLSRKQILALLDERGGGLVEDNTLTVYIKRLREKLAPYAQIETVRGLGYRAG
jgi:DNA-binding response OmpR family regulator